MPERLLPLIVDDLQYSIGQKCLISEPGFQLESAGISVILGPNGAGKSLLIRLLHGLIDPDRGSIRWNGRKLDEHVRRQQAMVFQKPVLLRRSVEANIKFVLKNAGDDGISQCERILRQSNLLAQRKQPARLLSGGEQQRLALARALATSPQVLFLDEPTANIDPRSTLGIEEQLRQVSDNGVKLILVTHDIGQAHRLASDVLFMHDGSILEHTRADIFFNRPKSSEAKAYLHGDLVI